MDGLKPFLKPYESINDERFTWLTGKFLKYFTDWKIYIAARPGEFTDNARSSICSNRKILSRFSRKLFRMTKKIYGTAITINTSTQKLFQPIAGNCRNEDPQLAKIDVETVPCRKSNRK